VPEGLTKSGFGSLEFAAKTGVSQKTLSQLEAYAGLLVDWNERQNLVAKSTLPGLWHRHFWDSAQLAPLIPQTASTLADLGSGAGFPGLVLAVLRPDLKVTLCEATAKKCYFLQAAADCMGLAVEIRNARLEDLPSRAFDVVMARALAPLPRLLHYAYRFTGQNTVCLFLKGQNVGIELTAASKYWNMKVSRVPSQTDPSAAIVTVRELDPRHAATPKAARPSRRQPKRRGR
jgi:16S rRNA (guanine527-N7)-methyltransferase